MDRSSASPNADSLLTHMNGLSAADGGDGSLPIAPPTPATRMTPPPGDADSLFEHNVQQINLMNVAAGSMVKGLIMELQRAGRNTFIRLRDAEVDGHVVSYDFVSGEPELVGRIGRALGFASVTDDRLEVRHG